MFIGITFAHMKYRFLFGGIGMLRSMSKGGIGRQDKQNFNAMGEGIFGTGVGIGQNGHHAQYDDCGT